MPTRCLRDRTLLLRRSIALLARYLCSNLQNDPKSDLPTDDRSRSVAYHVFLGLHIVLGCQKTKSVRSDDEQTYLAI